MPAKPTLSSTDKLERELGRLLAAEKRKFKNEDTILLEKNGDLTYERIRTTAVNALSRRAHAATEDVPSPITPYPSETTAERASESTVGNALHAVPQPDVTNNANSYTETPSSPQNGQQFPSSQANSPSTSAVQPVPQVPASTIDTATRLTSSSGQIPDASAPISIHDPSTTGQQIASSESNATDPSLSRHAHATTGDDTPADPLEELLARAIAKPRRGRPALFDEHSKGKLVALLSLGMSLRQAAAVLGVSHGTIHNTLKADQALSDEITAARFQAQLQPLACVIREARRSWKAATWLLKYLDSKIATHEETPDERRARQQRETDEFFARPISGVKKRKA